MTVAKSLFTPPGALTRRHFLAGVVASAVTARLEFAQTPEAAGNDWILLGTQDGEGVYRARWNAATGELGAPELAVATPRPSYIALHPRLPVLYACNEHDGDSATISAFQVDRRGATLTALVAQKTRGNAPCYASIDRTGRLLFSANYSGGSLSAFPLDTHGSPGPENALFSCDGHAVCGHVGPVSARQDAPHLHCAVVSPDNRSVLACDLGDDAILVFPIHPSAAQPLGSPTRLAARRGSGPRHLIFAPDGGAFYCIHELDCSVDVYDWPGTAQALAGGAKLVGSPVSLSSAGNAADSAVPNTGAEIAVSRDGRFVYASVRGINELSVLQVHPGPKTALEVVQTISCGGDGPRFFALDPSERWLLCANQNSSSVTIFTRDAQTGRLTSHSKQSAPSPMCLVWV